MESPCSTATADVVHELRARGPFSSTLFGIVALDDVWGLLLFSVLLAAAELWNGTSEALSCWG